MTTTIDREPTERQEEAAGHSDRELAWARGLVIAIGLTFLAIHLLFMPRDWPVGWDESVYLSQVTPGMEGLFFNPWHARGITLIVGPVTSLGGSVADVRLFLMVLASFTITATFWLWIPLVGMAAPIAAFVFSFSWQGQVLASEVKPNYWGALLGLAATAFVARRLEGGRTLHVVLASVLLAATALVRPTEATVLAAPSASTSCCGEGSRGEISSGWASASRRVGCHGSSRCRYGSAGSGVRCERPARASTSWWSRSPRTCFVI